MKATEQYFPVVLLIMLYKVVLTFESVDEILKCDHSNESDWELLVCARCLSTYSDEDVVVLTFTWFCGGNSEVQNIEMRLLSLESVRSNFWVWGWNPKVWSLKWKTPGVHWLFSGAVRANVDEIFRKYCEHQIESSCRSILPQWYLCSVPKWKLAINSQIYVFFCALWGNWL